MLAKIRPDDGVYSAPSILQVFAPEALKIVIQSIRNGIYPSLAATIAMEFKEPSASSILGLLEIKNDLPIRIGIIISRSEEHTSELQSLMRNSYAVFCLKKKRNTY